MAAAGSSAATSRARGGNGGVGKRRAYPAKEAADPTPPSLDLAIPWLDPAGGCVVGGGRGRGAAAHQGRQHRRDEAVATVRRCEEAARPAAMMLPLRGGRWRGDLAASCAAGRVRLAAQCAGGDGGARLDGGGAGGCRGCGPRKPGQHLW